MASTVSPFPQRNVASDAASADAPALAGGLDQMPLPDLLQTASTNGRTGRIDLDGGDDAQQDPSSGRIWLRDGRIVDATIRSNDEEFSGRNALYRLLSWSHGRFALVQKDVDLPDRIQDSTSFLLLDAMRQLDEQRRAGSPGHAGLPEEPPEPSRAEQAVHLSLLLLNVTATWVGSQLQPKLVAERFDDVRDVLRTSHPQLERFAVSPKSGLAGLADDLGPMDDDEIDRLVTSLGVWLRGFYRRIERSLPGKFSLERLAELTGAHADQLTELGFHKALGWPDRWPEADTASLAVTPESVAS